MHTSIRYSCHLRELRQRRQVSQQEIAQMLGRTRSYISFLERGKRQLKGVEIAQLLAFFRCTFEELIDIDW